MLICIEQERDVWDECLKPRLYFVTMIILELLTTRWRVTHLFVFDIPCESTQYDMGGSLGYLLKNLGSEVTVALSRWLGDLTFWDQNPSKSWHEERQWMSCQKQAICVLKPCRLEEGKDSVNSTIRSRQVMIHIPTVIHSGHCAQAMWIVVVG